MLEFALGMAVALAYNAGARVSPKVAVVLAALALTALAIDPMNSAVEPFDAVTPNGFLRLLSWGAPMAALFAAATFGPAPAAPGPGLRALAKVGDASYALYLFHPLSLVVLRKLWLALHLDAALGFWPLVVAATLASLVLALAIHTWIEMPLTKVAQQWLSPQLPGKTAGAAAPV